MAHWGLHQTDKGLEQFNKRKTTCQVACSEAQSYIVCLFSLFNLSPSAKRIPLPNISFMFLSSSASHYPLPCSSLREDVILNHRHGQLCSLPHIHAAGFSQKEVPSTSRKWKKSHSPKWSQNKRKKLLVFEGSTIMLMIV